MEHTDFRFTLFCQELQTLCQKYQVRLEIDCLESPITLEVWNETKPGNELASIKLDNWIITREPK